MRRARAEGRDPPAQHCAQTGNVHRLGEQIVHSCLGTPNPNPAGGVCSQRDDGNTRTFCDQNSCYGVAVDFGHMDVTHNEIEGLREHEFAIKRAILSEHTDCNFAVLGEFDNGTCFSENMAYQSLIVRTIFHEQDT